MWVLYSFTSIYTSSFSIFGYHHYFDYWNTSRFVKLATSSTRIIRGPPIRCDVCSPNYLLFVFEYTGYRRPICAPKDTSSSSWPLGGICAILRFSYVNSGDNVSEGLTSLC